MSMRKKSLLDAFRAVPPGKGTAARPGEAAPRPQRPVPPPEPARAMAPGPVPARVVAPQPPTPPPTPRAPTPRAQDPRPNVAPPRATSERAPLSRDRLVLFALAGVTVLVVIAMMMRRGHETDVSADGGQTATPPAAENHASAPAPTQATPDVGSTAQDRAFMDTKNKVTIRVGQFDNDAAGTAAAQTAYRYLLTEGALVVRPIVGLDAQHIILCVDAKPKPGDLEAARVWLHGLRGPSSGKKLPYADAWIDNISNVVRR